MQKGRTHRESKTFDREPAAPAWIKKREKALEDPEAWGGLQQDGYPRPSDRPAHGREHPAREDQATGSQLPAEARYLEPSCEMVTSEALVDLATDLKAGRSASTMGNYLSHLGTVFSIAKPAWGFALDEAAIDAAKKVARKLGHTGKSRTRERRPSLEEMNQLMEYFGDVRQRRPYTIPIQYILAFARFSTRRQEEITRITWDDLDEEASTIIVRNMKDPGEKIGNDVRCDLPPEALRIIRSMPRVVDKIFPSTTDAISAAMTRATNFLGIDNLHFHDLRHEGVSRQFEMGRTIPQAAGVSGHRSWSSLKRYTHLRGVGDRCAGWTWLNEIAPIE